MKKFIPFIVIIILTIIAYAFGLGDYFTFDMLKANRMKLLAFTENYPILAPLIFITIYTTAIALSLPGGALLSLFGGFLFPLPLSTLYVITGATIGASAIFLAAKTALQEFLRKKAAPFLQKMESGFNKNPVSYLLFLRFIPLFPFWLVNLAPAFFNVRFRTYLWTTIVGILPGSYVFTQAGAGLGAIFDSGESFNLSTIFNTQIKIALIALAIFSLVPILIKKFRKKDAS